MGNRSVSVGRDAIGSSIVTGDQNLVRTGYRSTLPPASEINLKAEVTALRELLATLDAPDKGKLERALADAEEEASKPEPDRDEVGGALERAIKYAKQANGFAEQIGKLRPHLEAACSWLGENWYKLLAAAGLGAAL